MAKEARSLQGKVAAITGGARGIGKATARALAREGVKVAIGDIDRALAEETAAGLEADAVGLELDVTRRDSFERFLDQVSERLGPLEVVINNAGIMPIGSFVDEDDATARRMIDINVHGVIYGMKLAIPGCASGAAATSSTWPHRPARRGSTSVIGSSTSVTFGLRSMRYQPLSISIRLP